LINYAHASKQNEIEIKVIPTQRALHFFDPKEFAAGVDLLTDEDEWKV
jgi:hypothetical protein